MSEPMGATGDKSEPLPPSGFDELRGRTETNEALFPALLPQAVEVFQLFQERLPPIQSFRNFGQGIAHNVQHARDHQGVGHKYVFARPRVGGNKPH
eukprot:2687893-Alexandrium_andersonii.AAC.1